MWSIDQLLLIYNEGTTATAQTTIYFMGKKQNQIETEPSERNIPMILNVAEIYKLLGSLLLQAWVNNKNWVNLQSAKKTRKIREENHKWYSQFNGVPVSRSPEIGVPLIT